MAGRRARAGPPGALAVVPRLAQYHQSVRLALDDRRAGERYARRQEDADDLDASRDQANGSLDTRLRAMSGVLDAKQGPVTALLGSRNGVPRTKRISWHVLTFGITVFEVLERYGVNWTADEQEAYLHALDIIGAYLGIGTQDVVSRLEERYAERANRGWAASPPGPIVGNQWRGLRPPTVTQRGCCSSRSRAPLGGPDPKNHLRFHAGRAFVPVAS